MERTITDLKLKVVAELAGKMNLAQDYAERKELVCEVFLALGANPEDKGLIKKVGFVVDMASAENFARDFLELEVISGFLNDQDVEDIVIDGLKPIFPENPGQSSRQR